MDPKDSVKIMIARLNGGTIQRPELNSQVINAFSDFLNGNNRKLDFLIRKQTSDFLKAIKYRIGRLSYDDTMEAFQRSCVEMIDVINRGYLWRSEDPYAYLIKICHNNAIEVIKERDKNLRWNDEISIDRHYDKEYEPSAMWDCEQNLDY